jgi:hypothetical protein
MAAELFLAGRGSMNKEDLRAEIGRPESLLENARLFFLNPAHEEVEFLEPVGDFFRVCAHRALPACVRPVSVRGLSIRRMRGEKREKQRAVLRYESIDNPGLAQERSKSPSAALSKPGTRKRETEKPDRRQGYQQVTQPSEPEQQRILHFVEDLSV